MTIKQFNSQFWKRYITLEKEFFSTTHYVTLDVDNYQTYSPAYAILLLQIGSEVDIVAKEYCKLLDERFDRTKRPDIQKYRNCINTNEPNFIRQKMFVYNAEILLTPWSNWEKNDENGRQKSCDKMKLEWWDAYNCNKHKRVEIGKIGNDNTLSKEYYRYANLWNVLNALAALYQLLEHTYLKLATKEDTDIPTPLPGSRLFYIKGDLWEDIPLYSGDYFLVVEEGCLMGKFGDFMY